MLILHNYSNTQFCKFYTFIADKVKVVSKEPVEAPYAVSAGSSMLVFIIFEAVLILFMDFEWVMRRRNRKQKKGKRLRKQKKGQKKRGKVQKERGKVHMQKTADRSVIEETKEIAHGTERENLTRGHEYVEELEMQELS